MSGQPTIDIITVTKSYRTSTPMRIYSPSPLNPKIFLSLRTDKITQKDMTEDRTRDECLGLRYMLSFINQRKIFCRRKNAQDKQSSIYQKVSRRFARAITLAGIRFSSPTLNRVILL